MIRRARWVAVRDDMHCCESRAQRRQVHNRQAHRRSHGDQPWRSRIRNHRLQPEDNGGSEGDGREKGGWAALVAPYDAAPVLETAKHDLAAIAAAIAKQVLPDGLVARFSAWNVGLDALGLQDVPEPVNVAGVAE